MNAMQSSTIDGKSMTCMQSSSGSSTKTMPDSARSETSTEPEKIKNFKRTLLSVEEEKSIHKTHANNVLITADANSNGFMSKRSPVCRRWMCSYPTQQLKYQSNHTQQSGGKAFRCKTRVGKDMYATCVTAMKWLTVL